MASALAPCAAGALVFLLAMISARIYAVQLKRRALLVVVALVATFASASAFASIPRSDILSPAITRASFDLASPTRPERSEVLPLVEQLRGALEEALPASEQLSSLAETRVRAFGDLAPFEQQQPSELTRALHQAYAEFSEGSASDQAFCAGDPVNGRDPTGEQVGPGSAYRFAEYFHSGEVAEDADELAAALKKEAAATAAEELTPAGVWNSVSTALFGYDVVRQEDVHGFLPRTLAGIAAIPGVPSIVRKLDDVLPSPIRKRLNLLHGRKLQPKPEGVRFGKPRGGGGKPAAREYARTATQAEKAVYLDVPGFKEPVEFDALINGVLIDAKAAGQIKPRSIYDLTSTDPFIHQMSRKNILGQAQRQLAAARHHGRKIEWRIADEKMAEAVEDFFAEQRIQIAIRYIPPVPK